MCADYAGSSQTPTEGLVPGEQCVVFVLHPWMAHPLQAMPAGAPAYPSRHSLTPILHFLGLRKSQGVMELVGSCGVQELEQGRIGECRDISGHCTDC